MGKYKREQRTKGSQRKDFQGTIKTRAGRIIGSTDTTAQPCRVSQKMTTGRATLGDVTIAIAPRHFAQAPTIFREVARLAEGK